MTKTTTRGMRLIIAFYARYGLGVRVTSTDRSKEEQDELFRQGKTRLAGGLSFHNVGRAFDMVPGSPWPTNVDRNTSYKHLASVGRSVGFQAVVEADHVHFENPWMDP